MGCSLFRKSCYTNPSVAAPNPDPSRWVLLDKVEFEHSYALKVKYLDVTNFEGIKVMVYRGKFASQNSQLDPHFTQSNNSPVARFPPNEEGWKWAVNLAVALSHQLSVE